MDRKDMLEMLHALDKELKAPLKIAITGSSALIIRGCISRSSNDIDVLQASDRLDRGPLKEIVEKIAAKYKLRSDWVDTRPSDATFRDLPGYMPDLQRIEGEQFKYLQPYIISKADSVLTKFAHYTNIRQWDKGDIKSTNFTDDDFKSITIKLKTLKKSDPERALRIEIEFKSVKPEFIKTEECFSYSKASEVAKYAMENYGISISENDQKQLDNDVLNMRSSYQKAIIELDISALDKIVKAKSKDHDHGMDL
jgi:hypothetical protein